VDIKGILFDKDGTLVDFDRTWIPAYHKALDELCDTHPDPNLKIRCLQATGYDAENDCIVPNSPLAVEGSDDVAAMWLEVAGEAPKKNTVDRLVSIMETAAADAPSALFDVAALFDRLSDRGMILGIATMDAEWVARRSLAHFKADGHTRFYAGYDSGYGRKPDPGMVLAFSEQKELLPSQIMVVGDNLHDLHMGINAGAGLSVGVCSGVANRVDLADVADYVVEDATGIEALLDRFKKVHQES
jgi:phosphoglycolate phosphatase